jgi:hypothetical protein
MNQKKSAPAALVRGRRLEFPSLPLRVSVLA